MAVKVFERNNSWKYNVFHFYANVILILWSYFQHCIQQTHSVRWYIYNKSFLKGPTWHYITDNHQEIHFYHYLIPVVYFNTYSSLNNICFELCFNFVNFVRRPPSVSSGSATKPPLQITKTYREIHSCVWIVITIFFFSLGISLKLGPRTVTICLRKGSPLVSRSYVGLYTRYPNGEWDNSSSIFDDLIEW